MQGRRWCKGRPAAAAAAAAAQSDRTGYARGGRAENEDALQESLERRCYRQIKEAAAAGPMQRLESHGHTKRSIKLRHMCIVL